MKTDMNDGDPLAHAATVPNISALIEEFEQAQLDGACNPGNIGAAEDVRYNRWAGKSNPSDGCRWQKNAATGQPTVRPYDGRPDTDVQLADEITGTEVDVELTAVEMAQIGATTTHVSKLTASQVAELRAVVEWIRRVTRGDLRDDGELLAQMTSMIGWCVLNPGWLERTELVNRELDLESLVSSAPPEEASVIAQLVLDPSLEEQAMELLRQRFAHLGKSEASRVIRDLRETGSASFLDKQVAERRPTIRTLIPGYNYFIAGTAGKINKARGHLVIERFYQADFEATAASNGWNLDFVKAAIAHAGEYSSYGEAMREKADTGSMMSEDRSIEIWTTHVLQFDTNTGAAGIYCTTFSPHVKPGADGVTEEHYAKHYLLAFAHGQAPFVQTRREVIGPSLNDSRGVPEMVRGDQKVIKDLQDAGIARAHLEVNPPRAFMGAGWSKVNGLAPGKLIDNLIGQGDIKDLGPVRGNPQFGELAIQRVENGTRRRFALPNNMDGSHPSTWQMRQLRTTKRWLAAFEDAYWQMAVVCYQELDVYELAAIIGRWPQLTVEDLLKHRVTLTFDARALDSDWVDKVLKFVVQLLGIDTGGLMDHGPIIEIGLRYIDPALVDSIMRNPAGAQAALYRQVEQDIASIMDSNPPQLRENDQSAQMQLQMAFAVIGKNPKYQQLLQQDQQIQENVKTYLENLQHNVQETQLSPQQGRLGVSAMPQRPVQQGPAAMGEGGGDY